AHALFAFTFLTPWVGMVTLGIGYSLLACTIWAMISFVVPERTLGTAYGLTQAIQNLGLGVVPMAMAVIVDSKGYLVLEILFLALLSDNESVVRNEDTVNEADVEKEEDYSDVGYCHPAHQCHRYFFMVFMCTLGIGNYFSFDSPGALQTQTMDDMNISATEFGLLYSLYSWPNVVLNLLGGFLVDRLLGIKLGAIIFACFTFTGQFLVGLGAYLNLFWLMCLGRFVFAIGGDNLDITANMRAVKWFKGKDLSLVFGLQLSISRAAATINLNVMKPIYDWVGGSYSGHQQLGITLIIASVVAAYDLVIGIVLAFRDTWPEKKLKAEDVKSDKINIKDIKEFKLDYWLITIVITLFYMTIIPFVSYGIPFFARKYKFNATNSQAVDSIVYMMSIGASPILGISMGRVGRNVTFVLLAVFISLAAHALFAFTFLTPWVGMVTLGIGYSLLACTIWAMISFVVPERTLGTAYGLTQAIQNLGLGVVPMAMAVIVDSKGYLVLEILFLALLSGMTMINFMHNYINV
ncbi:unnamed protein product, partial [Medioppia subpectinata]